MLFSAPPAVIALTMNRVAADVRRLHLFSLEEVRASLHRLLRSKVSRRKSLLVILALMAIVACLHANETNTENTNLVIGLLVPPEEPAAARLRGGTILGVELANQTSSPRVS